MNLRPSEAARKKYCSAECSAEGRRVASVWSRVIGSVRSGEWPQYRDLPLVTDPDDRARLRAKTIFVRDGDSWTKYTRGRKPVPCDSAPECELG